LKRGLAPSVRGYFVRSTAVATVQIRLVIAAAGMAVESRKENIEISTPDQLGTTERVPHPTGEPDVF
jgi:hypothetical protein